ncbi:PLDc N-terminal domain-containing protein [Corynebacterium aquatimens]|uniref:PLDc N-terminal domain-containing protein n=1 Tax=Corynebacterium TaxID=1716 RepID=UPI001F3E1FDA|nr:MULTISPECIES: PLDc N-terminal domain-containing protein [Corynebacterium]QYH19719.1 PLDc N-terminal domain-containing protein [Corynebacterium aquatimens]UIZ93184.1 PLDc N-terminal domain-containing protein [Corynebacterium sp. CNCTC7651]
MASNETFLDTLRDGWNAMSNEQRTFVGILAAVDTAAKGAALWDLARVDDRSLRGPKWLWATTIPVLNTVGWLAYFTVGRKY